MTAKANISWITDTLATGGDLSFDPTEGAEQVVDIVKQGIRLVIDVRKEASDEDIWEPLGIEYLHLPTEDKEGHHIPSELFAKAVTEARHHIDAGEKVLIHCHMGVNRGPSVAYAVLLDLDYDPRQAFDLIREKRPIAAIWYAMDALEAELERRDFHHPTDVILLKRHIDRVFTEEDRMKVNHAIREGHRKDREVLERVRAEL